jgi:hypothetical protein
MIQGVVITLIDITAKSWSRATDEVLFPETVMPRTAEKLNQR